MKYLLFVAFATDIYKKSPTIRVNVNDTLIDEFDSKMKNSIYLNNLKNKLDNPLDPKIIFPTPGGPEQMIVYEISLISDKAVIRIDIINDDNNFTNGFMTKFTSVTLLYLVLIPKKILTKKKIERFKKYRFHKSSSLLQTNDPNIIKQFYIDRPYIIDNGKSEFYDNDDRKIYSNAIYQTNGYSGTYFCHYRKKFGMHLSQHKKNYSGYYRFSLKNLQSLYDKYLKYENQRDNN